MIKKKNSKELRQKPKPWPTIGIEIFELLRGESHTHEKDMGEGSCGAWEDPIMVFVEKVRTKIEKPSLA